MIYQDIFSAVLFPAMYAAKFVYIANIAAWESEPVTAKIFITRQQKG